MAVEPIRYLIVGCARSGTTVVDEMITGHPEVSSIRDEIRVVPFFSSGLSTFTYNHELPEETNRGWTPLFDVIAGVNRTDTTRALGFKTAVHHLHEAQWIVRNVERVHPQLRVIFINRNDLVAQYGSLRRAARSKHWHSWSKGTTDPNERVQTELSAFSQYAKECLEIVKQLQTLKHKLPFIEISYEDQITRDLDGCSKDLFEFIGLTPCRPTWITSRKVAPAPESYIDRYVELTRELTRLKEGADPLPWSFRMHMKFMKLRLSELRSQASHLIGIGPISASRNT